MVAINMTEAYGRKAYTLSVTALESVALTKLRARKDENEGFMVDGSRE